MWSPSRRRLQIAVPLVAVLALASLLAVVARSRSAPAAAADPVVAVVGSQEIHQSEFDGRVGFLLVTAQNGGAPQPGSAGYDTFRQQIRARAMQSLIIDAVIGQEAAFRHVAATDADLDREVQGDARIAGGQDRLETQLAEAGSSMTQLRDETRARLNEAQLEDALAKERAAEVLARLHGGADLAALAKQFSDDDTSRDRGGDLGSLDLTTLRAGDQAFLKAITALGAGQTTTTPVRDAAGYEILRVDAATSGSRHVHRILVSAPQPYTEKERPDWFTQSVFLAVADDCHAGRIRVLIDSGFQPCGQGTASPAASGGGSRAASPGAATPAPGSAAPGGGSGFSPRPAPGATPAP